ncbi:hypothetical protein WR25_08743 [Diploscapter pachys]|uniref:BED-type domain-containing protein n=1 Tax=Diploscapter pachys TaxID=2018661 RepID=A0A2A2KMT8_9BILA|nr:hypothetical protein WR25_08743 [Diploscapter pachys]
MISTPLQSSTGPPSAGPAPLSVPPFPSAFAAFASQLRNAQLHSLLQSQISVLQSQRQHEQQQQNGGLLHTPSPGPIQKQRGSGEYSTGRKRLGGPTVKTAKVWRFFDELPTVEQATECRLCRKKIKATNSRQAFLFCRSFHFDSIHLSI